MSSAFPNLLSPLRIGKVVVRNRILSSSHGERMSEDGLISPREIGYYAEKARGGTGLIVLDGVRTSIESAPNRHTLIGTRKGQLEGYRRLSDAVHEHGAKIFGQILHQGAQTATTYSRRALVSASAIANPVYREIPHAADKADIARIIEEMAESARIMKDGGLDGAELHAAHGYLIAQFLSAKTNVRTDAYGGDLQNRMRFGLEAIRAVRDAVGEDFAFGVRLNAEDLTRDGCTREDMLIVADAFVAAGALDFLSISVGTYYEDGLSIMVGDFGYRPGFLAANSAPFKQRFAGLPIATVGRINTPELAEEILARGDADMVAVARAIIADPEWANKAAANESHRIRPCIACNTCLAMNRAVTPITCAVNPTCGEELTLGVARREKAAAPATVLVVGAGVAGLEAARAAAERGHKVTLFEQREAVGGQVALLARTKNRAEMGRLTDYYRVELDRLGVEIRTGAIATPETLKAFGPAHVIVATGARSKKPEPTFAAQCQVEEAVAVLADPRLLQGRRRALVIDRDHYYGATTLCHHLRDHDVAVDLVTENPMIGADLPPGALAGVLRRLLERKVAVHTLARLSSIEDGKAQLDNLLGGAGTEISGVDLIVYVGERSAVDELYGELSEQGSKVVLVGDAMAPRQIWQAVRDGFFAGHSI